VGSIPIASSESSNCAHLMGKLWWNGQTRPTQNRLPNWACGFDSRQTGSERFMREWPRGTGTRSPTWTRGFESRHPLYVLVAGIGRRSSLKMSR
jgi:hypothetical protein